jgi:predicted RNase H-like nuclease
VSGVLGVDGSRGGWVGALVRGQDVRWLVLPDVRAALAVDAEVVAIDMPIGLPDTGRRACDLQAKRLLRAAHPRVFLAPPREVLDQRDHPAASARHRELADGAGLSVQTWHIVQRMREVDDAADDPRLVEVHPELSFAALAGRVLDRKKTAAGRAERLTALRSWLPGLDLVSVPPGDDAPDALAAAWSGRRWLDGVARVLPAGPPRRDARGRPMRIVT